MQSFPPTPGPRQDDFPALQELLSGVPATSLACLLLGPPLAFALLGLGGRWVRGYTYANTIPTQASLNSQVIEEGKKLAYPHANV